MCWRDNERDWAGENASRELVRSEREREIRGREWALKATAAQKRAALSEKLLINLLMLVTQKGNYGVGPHTLFSNDLHTHFPVFASRVGLRDTYYRLKSGKCPAISFYGQLSGFKDGQWMGFIGYCPDYQERLNICLKQAKELRVSTNKEILLKAATAFLDATREKYKKQTSTPTTK